MEDNRKLMCIPKRNHSKVIKVFQVYADVIVDILKDSTTSFREYELLMQDLGLDLPFGSDIWNLFKKHERTYKIFSSRYLEVQELGGDFGKIDLPNNLFIKYINGLRKKKIGRVKDEHELDSYDRQFWDRQVLFKEIIEENILKYYQTGKGEYYYTTVDDVLKLFSGELEPISNQGKDLYSNFLNEYGSFDFNLTCDSIGKYMNSIARSFCKQRIHFKGHRMNIYTLVNNDPTT